MCYVRMDHESAQKVGNVLTTDQWLQLAEESKKAGVISLEITGGEAVTRSDFNYLFKKFSHLGFLIILRTNGYLIDEEKIELFRNNRPRMISVTFYGASDETYKKVCGVNEGFSTVAKNVLNMKNAGLNLKLTTTITKDNVDDLKKLESWATEHGLQLHSYGGLFNPFKETGRTIKDLKVDFFKKEDNCLFDDDFVNRKIPQREKYMEPFWMCRGFGGQFAISWNGHMRLCNTLPSISRKVFEEELIDTYHSLYKDLRKVRRPKKCETCQYIDFCVACPMRFFSETGSVECTNNNICDIARKRYLRSLRSKSLV